MADSLTKSPKAAGTLPEKNIDLLGCKAVILFPALGTPEIVSPGGAVKVLIAAQKPLFKVYKAENGGSKPGPIKAATARRIHSQLCLIPWRERLFSSHQPGIFHYHKDIDSYCHMLYCGQEHSAASYSGFCHW
jgi:hypothetical protein